MNLSKNFVLDEFLKSQTATRHKIEEQFNPPDNIVENLKELCYNLLQPIRDTLPGYIVISSGYRSPELNRRIKGARSSQHMKGQAADCNYYEDGIEQNMILFDKVIKLGLPFDQMIKEYGTEEYPAWIHLSFSERNRKQILTIK